MATQPIDRQRSKHQHIVSKRDKPQMVNRGHKYQRTKLVSPYIVENNRPSSGWNLSSYQSSPYTYHYR